MDHLLVDLGGIIPSIWSMEYIWGNLINNGIVPVHELLKGKLASQMG